MLALMCAASFRRSAVSRVCATMSKLSFYQGWPQPSPAGVKQLLGSPGIVPVKALNLLACTLNNFKCKGGHLDG